MIEVPTESSLHFLIRPVRYPNDLEPTREALAESRLNEQGR
jgi:hypothetical protein